MTQLLISVTNVAEAEIALEHGADFIDLKDPTKGALGALPLTTIHEVVAYVNNQNQYGKRLTSATIGDLPMQAELILEHVVALTKTKVDIIKIGFFEAADYQPCLDTLKTIAQNGVKLIAVLFAEYQYPASLISAIKTAGFYGVMLDTSHKNGATFLDYFSEKTMQLFAKNVHTQGLLFGLAGSLTLQHVAIVKTINPSYVGFRGGVCDQNQRNLSLSAEKIKAIRKAM
jgi:uncharacterized protein (UPF0264 family)